MSKKVYIAIFLLIIVIVATVAIIFAIQPAPAKAAVVGVKAGDGFTYRLVGTSDLTALDAIETPGFSQYNQTDYYKITITYVNDTSVSFDTLWRFINGTEITGKQTVDISNGQKTDSDGFWAIYSANLTVGDLLRPTGFDGLTVNQTDTKTFADSTRVRNFWFIENQFFDVKDPTYSTLRFDYTSVYFDKQTGILETLTNYQQYNNPAKKEIITWNLVNSTVWAVQ